MPSRRRAALAKRLLAGEGQTVGRQLVDGDFVIMNRQPTLHKVRAQPSTSTEKRSLSTPRLSRCACERLISSVPAMPPRNVCAPSQVSMMAHQVRVFKYLPPSQQTIRMHYANCNSYNADFDGDEMNCHLPMSLLGKAECQQIVHNPHQYIVPTDGSPVRGLIQVMNFLQPTRVDG